MKAAANGHSDVVQLLISAGVRLDEKDIVEYKFVVLSGVHDVRAVRKE